MTVLTPAQARAYCEPLDIGVEMSPNPCLYFDECSDCRVYVMEFGDAADASFDTAATMVEPDRVGFRGAVVWLTGYRPPFENYETAFRRILGGFGVDGWSGAPSAYHFGPDEFADAVVMMGFLMTFGWDATWAPGHGEYLMSVDNDRMLDFAVRGGGGGGCCGGRWDEERKELFDNLSLKRWPQLTPRYCGR